MGASGARGSVKPAYLGNVFVMTRLTARTRPITEITFQWPDRPITAVTC